MPEQKGKKKTKRERRRFGVAGGDTSESDLQSTRPASRGSGSRPVARRGFQPSLRVNAIIGIGLLVLGIFFFVTNLKHLHQGQTWLILLAYCLLAGFYLVRAVRQYRAQRQS
jgi:hypothetical protein